MHRSVHIFVATLFVAAIIFSGSAGRAQDDLSGELSAAENAAGPVPQAKTTAPSTAKTKKSDPVPQEPMAMPTAEAT